MHDHLSIPCLAVIFILAAVYEIFTDSNKYFTICSHIFLSHIYDLSNPCLADILVFFLYVITFLK